MRGDKKDRLDSVPSAEKLDRYGSKATMLQSRANKTAIYQWQGGRRLQRRAPQMQSDLGRRRWGWWLCCSGTRDETSRTTCRRAAGQQVQQGSSRHLSVDEGPPKRHMYAREKAR